MRLYFVIALIGCVSLVRYADAQGLLASFLCSTDPIVLQHTCPLDCDLAVDTLGCPVCVCQPCICPEPCYVPTFTGGLHGECPGCASSFQCRLSFFRSRTRRADTNIPLPTSANAGQQHKLRPAETSTESGGKLSKILFNWMP